MSSSLTGCCTGSSGSSNISSVIFPAAISRSATTVGLSFSHSTVASAPLARRRARFAANNTKLNRLGSFCRQSSTVIRAILKGSIKGIVRVAENPQGGPLVTGRTLPVRPRHSGPGQQFHHQAPHFRSLLVQVTAAILHDGEQFVERLLEAVVDDDVVEFGPVRDILRRIFEPALDHRLGI